MDQVEGAQDIIGERYNVGLSKLHLAGDVQNLFEVVFFIIHDHKDGAQVFTSLDFE